MKHSHKSSTYYFVQERSYFAKAVKSDSNFPMIENFAPYYLCQKSKISEEYNNVIQARDTFTFPDAGILFVKSFQERIHSSLESL